MLCVVTFKRGGDTYLADMDDTGYRFLSALRLSPSSLNSMIDQLLPCYCTFKEMGDGVRKVKEFSSDEDALEYAALEAL